MGKNPLYQTANICEIFVINIFELLDYTYRVVPFIYT